MLPGGVLTEAHLYIGTDKYPENNQGNPTVSNGQFPYKAEDLHNVSNLQFDPVNVGDNGFYIILHAVTCPDNVMKAPVLTKAEVYHVPYQDMMNLDLEIAYDANVEVEFMDLSGKLIMRSAARPVKEGRNILQYNINKLATEVHMMKIQTGRELIIKKVLFVK